MAAEHRRVLLSSALPASAVLLWPSSDATPRSPPPNHLVAYPLRGWLVLQAAENVLRFVVFFQLNHCAGNESAIGNRVLSAPEPSAPLRSGNFAGSAAPAGCCSTPRVIAKLATPRKYSSWPDRRFCLRQIDDLLQNPLDGPAIQVVICFQSHQVEFVADSLLNRLLCMVAAGRFHF